MKRSESPRILSFLLLLLSAAFASGQSSPSAAPPDLASANALGQDLFLQSGSTGMALVVVRGNQVFFHGYGETAPGSHQVPTQDSLLRLCSLTKVFTSDLLFKLASDRVVRLEDPLQRYAPSGVVVPKRERPITLFELATHTSGLPRELGNAPSNTPHFTYPDFRTRWHWLPNQHLRSSPGTAALYSNIGYDFLGDAIGSATHKQYAALLAERTLVPLHMWNTTYFPTLDQCSRLLTGAHDELACTITEPTAGSSGLYSSAADMTVWLKYLLGTGGPGVPAQDPAAEAVYIPPASLISQRGLDHAGEPTGVGLGWIHILPLDSPTHIIEKTGGGAGFETYIAINRAQRSAIFLAATEGPIDTHLNLFNAANKLLLSLAGLPPLPEPPPPPASRKHASRHKRSHRRP